MMNNSMLGSAVHQVLQSVWPQPVSFFLCVCVCAVYETESNLWSVAFSQGENDIVKELERSVLNKPVYYWTWAICYATCQTRERTYTYKGWFMSDFLLFLFVWFFLLNSQFYREAYISDQT